MKGLGAEVKQGKHLAFKISGGKRFARCDSLGDDYTEAAIKERIFSKRIIAPKAKAAVQSKPNLLIDIRKSATNKRATVYTEALLARYLAAVLVQLPFSM